ncbi:MAG: peptidyl-prolyl cis-trans isomerase [Planctomycetes bacterium]|nr:peptidyl-prolyl cis-trans isomerase [Planctomycetota bacterium]
MLRDFRKFFQKHERKAFIILAIVTALAFGISPQLINMAGQDENPPGTIYGREISESELKSIEIRWYNLNRYISGYISRNPYMFARAPHFSETRFQKWWDEQKDGEESIKRQYKSWQEAYFQKAFTMLNIAPFNLADYEEWWNDKPNKYSESLAKTIAVLAATADRLGIQVSDEEIQGFISSGLPFFRDPNTNQFSIDYYRFSVDREIQLTQAGFEKTIEEWIKALKLSGFRQEGEFPSLQDLFSQYILNNEEAKIKWAAFDPDDYKSKVKIESPEELEKYFRDNMPTYVVPDKIQAEYVIADYTKLKETVREPTPEEIKNYYDKNLDEFKITDSTPITPTITHKKFEEVQDEIKSKWKELEAKGAAIDKISEIKQRIDILLIKQKPVDLEAIAKEFGLSYEKTGFFSQDRVNEITETMGGSPAFAEQVFAFEKDIISDPVDCGKGQLIFKVLEKKVTYNPPFTMAIKEKVTRDIVKMKSKQAAENDCKELQTKITSSFTEESSAITGKTDEEKKKIETEIKIRLFEDILKAKGTPTNKSSWVKRDQVVPEHEEIDAYFLDKALLMETGDYTIIESKGIYYLVQVNAKRPPAGEDFDTQKPSLENEWMTKRSDDFNEKWRAEIKALVNNMMPPPAPQEQENKK